VIIENGSGLGATRRRECLPAFKIEEFRTIVEQKQFGKVCDVRVDLFSASAVTKVHDLLSPENREKFLALPVPKMVSVAFKLLG
jgi:hypothetical protein